MITSLRLINFKNFADETLHVGPFTLIVGANASGKSNLRDAFRFLHGIGRGYTLAEIVGGKYGTDWKPIRGGAGGMARFGARQLGEDFPPFALEAQIGLPPGDIPSGVGSRACPHEATYRIETRAETLGGSGLSVVEEHLAIDSEAVYSGDIFHDPELELSRTQPALHQLFPFEFDQDAYEHTRAVVHALARVRFLDLRPDQARMPGAPGQTRLGDAGENLPVALQKICERPDRKAVLIDWIRALTPMDVTDFSFQPDPSGRTHLVIHEAGGRKVPAESASDGTLRFLCMLAALLGEDSGGLYFLEEIENGLHPSRLHLLVDLIERQTATGRVQVIATTHSPDLIAMVSDETFEWMAITCRVEGTVDTLIRRVAHLPNAGKLRKSQGLGRLIAGGWMEDAVVFTAGGARDEKT